MAWLYNGDWSRLKRREIGSTLLELCVTWNEIEKHGFHGTHLDEWSVWRRADESAIEKGYGPENPRPYFFPETKWRMPDGSDRSFFETDAWNGYPLVTPADLIGENVTRLRSAIAAHMPAGSTRFIFPVSYAGRTLNECTTVPDAMHPGEVLRWSINGANSPVCAFVRRINPARQWNSGYTGANRATSVAKYIPWASFQSFLSDLGHGSEWAPLDDLANGKIYVQLKDAVEVFFNMIYELTSTYPLGPWFYGYDYPHPGARNEKQLVTINGFPTGGTFRLSYNGVQSGTIAWNASAAAVTTALNAIPTLNGRTATTGANGGPWTVEFVNSLRQTNVAQLVPTANLLTGGFFTPSIVVTTLQDGRATDQDSLKMDALMAFDRPTDVIADVLSDLTRTVVADPVVVEIEGANNDLYFYPPTATMRVRIMSERKPEFEIERHGLDVTIWLPDGMTLTYQSIYDAWRDRKELWGLASIYGLNLALEVEDTNDEWTVVNADGLGAQTAVGGVAFGGPHPAHRHCHKGIKFAIALPGLEGSPERENLELTLEETDEGDYVALTVQPATDGNGQITSTAKDVADLLNAEISQEWLCVVEIEEGDGSGDGVVHEIEETAIELSRHAPCERKHIEFFGEVTDARLRMKSAKFDEAGEWTGASPRTFIEIRDVGDATRSTTFPYPIVEPVITGHSITTNESGETRIVIDSKFFTYTKTYGTFRAMERQFLYQYIAAHADLAEWIELFDIRPIKTAFFWDDFYAPMAEAAFSPNGGFSTDINSTFPNYSFYEHFVYPWAGVYNFNTWGTRNALRATEKREQVGFPLSIIDSEVRLLAATLHDGAGGSGSTISQANPISAQVSATGGRLKKPIVARILSGNAEPLYYTFFPAKTENTQTGRDVTENGPFFASGQTWPKWLIEYPWYAVTPLCALGQDLDGLCIQMVTLLPPAATDWFTSGTRMAWSLRLPMQHHNTVLIVETDLRNALTIPKEQ